MNKKTKWMHMHFLKTGLQIKLHSSEERPVPFKVVSREDCLLFCKCRLGIKFDPSQYVALFSRFVQHK